jgi:radical SAM superfamily enzyme YgiQ (UPF0313 family)
MMNILLLYPYFLDVVPKTSGLLPPLSLGYLGSFVRKHGFKCDIIDCTGQGITHQEVCHIVRQERPDFVGISSTTMYIDRAIDLSMKIKNVCPATKVIVGGCHATVMAKAVLKESESVDIVIRGEGEETLLEILRGFQHDEFDLSTIKGISYRYKGKIIENGDRPMIKDMDSIPFPLRKTAENVNYRSSMKWNYRYPFASMITSRGCPYHCEFCNVHDMFGMKVRYRSVENVIEELNMLSKDYGIKEVVFYDDTLTINKKRVVEICERMISEKLDITWGCYSRSDAIDDKITKLMKKSGCHMISIGVETGSERILNDMKKGITLEQSRKAIEVCKKNGIETSASFVVGFNGETRKTIQETSRFAQEIDPTFMTIFRLVPYPGTSSYIKYLNERKLSKLSIQQFKELGNSRVIQVDDISEEELRKLIKKMYHSFYLRPSKLLQHFFRMFSFHIVKGYLRGLIWFVWQKME